MRHKLDLIKCAYWNATYLSPKVIISLKLSPVPHLNENIVHPQKIIFIILNTKILVSASLNNPKTGQKMLTDIFSKIFAFPALLLLLAFSLGSGPVVNALKSPITSDCDEDSDWNYKDVGKVLKHWILSIKALEEKNPWNINVREIKCLGF